MDEPKRKSGGDGEKEILQVEEEEDAKRRHGDLKTIAAVHRLIGDVHESVSSEKEKPRRLAADPLQAREDDCDASSIASHISLSCRLNHSQVIAPCLTSSRAMNGRVNNNISCTAQANICPKG